MRSKRLVALELLIAASGQLLVGHLNFEASFSDIDVHRVAVADETDCTAGSGLRGNVADRQSGGTAGEATIGDQCTDLTQASALDECGRVQHLLHARATGRTLVDDKENFARLQGAVQDDRDSLFLALYDTSGAFEVELILADTRGLQDSTVFGDVAAQDTQTAFLRVGVVEVANATIYGVRI